MVKVTVSLFILKPIILFLPIS